MSFKRHLLEAATLVAAAVLCAFVANLLASRERRLALPGSYPNATTVPAPPAVPPPPPAGARPPDPAPEPTRVAVPPSATPAASSRPAARPTAAVTNGTGIAAAAPAPAPKEDLLARFKPHPDAAYVEIGGDDVAVLHRSGALFVDARRTHAFEEGHVPGARNVSPWESDADAKVQKLAAEGHDPQAPIVVYCTGGECEDSHMVAEKLWRAGFENALVYKDGWPDWQKRRGPAETGPAR